MEGNRAGICRSLTKIVATTLLTSSALHAAPQALQVYFNHNTRNSYMDPRHFRRTGDNLEAVILSQINAARERLWIAVFDFDLPSTAQALIEKKKQGVDVRVVIDKNKDESFSRTIFEFFEAHSWGRIDAQALNVIKELRNAGIPVRDNGQGSGGSGLMHHKFMVVDRHAVLTGSANFTKSDVHGDDDNSLTRGNANSMLVFQSEKLNQIFAEEFGYLWGNGRDDSGRFGRAKPYRPAQSVWVDGSKVTVQFSPGRSDRDDSQLSFEGLATSDTIDLIADRLVGARSSVDFSLFVFSHQKLANALLSAVRKSNIQIRGLIDSGFIYRDYSEALDFWGLEMLNIHCKIEDNNNPWTQTLRTVGTPFLPVGDKLHHKYAVIDDTTVITGSHNWSESGQVRNDETVLVIESPKLAQAYHAESSRLAKIRTLWGAPNTLLKNIQEKKTECKLP